MNKLTKQVGHCRVFRGALIEQRQGFLHQCCQVFGICQPVALLFQFLFFARAQARRFNFVQLKGVQVHPAVCVPFGRTQFRQFMTQLLPFPVDVKI